MPRVKRAVHARKKRAKVLEEAKGYYGRKKSSYKLREGAGRPLARVRVPRPEGQEAHVPLALDRADQRGRARERALVQPLHGGRAAGGHRARPQVARDIAVSTEGVLVVAERAKAALESDRRGRLSFDAMIAVARRVLDVGVKDAGARILWIWARLEPDHDVQRRIATWRHALGLLIESRQNEKLRLVRKLLSARKHREESGLFAVESEDLVEAARDAGIEPVELLVAGENVAPRASRRGVDARACAARGRRLPACRPARRGRGR